MKKLLYVTSNQDKFIKAKINLEPFGISLTNGSIEMVELQSEDGEQIVHHKAEQAFAHFSCPLLTNDDTWSIPALNGFPSTNMKLCNDFLKAEDWLRLMGGITDRRVFLISYYAFHDGHSIKVVSDRVERQFLTEARGRHVKSPCLEVIGRAGSNFSLAEEISAGRKIDSKNVKFWQKLAQVLD